MAFLNVRKVKIAGISAAVPSQTEENVNVYKNGGGVRTLPFNYRHLASSEGRS